MGRQIISATREGLRARFAIHFGMDSKRQLPFDVDDPEVQRVCRAVLRLLMDDAGDEEARRTILAIMIGAI